MKEHTHALVRSILQKSTKWLSVMDISAQVNASRSTIRKCLRKDPYEFKSMKIPGTNKGSRQWAMFDADTTGWDNADVPFSQTLRAVNLIGTVTGRMSSVKSNPPNLKDASLMCNVVNKPSLIKATGELLVNEFITGGKKFSAFDVTKRLRDIELERAKNSTRNVPLPIITLPPIDKNETGEVYVLGYKLPRIEHEDVRSIVHDIFHSGGMPTLGRVRDSSDTYWEYDTQTNIDNDSVTII